MDQLDDDLAAVLTHMRGIPALPTGHTREGELIRLLSDASRSVDRWRRRRDEVETCLGLQTRTANDPVVAEVIRSMRRAPGSVHRLETLAATAGLSTTRLRHRFKQELGVSLSTFRRWNRIGVAMKLAGTGNTLTTAALEAGFASSAHFSTAFRAMFGVSPSMLIKTGLIVS